MYLPACNLYVAAGDFVEVLTKVAMSFFHFVSYISEVDK